MKNYKVTVNGTTYEVGVEEVGGAPEVRTVQAAAPAARQAPTAAHAPRATPAPRSAAPTAGAEDIVAPLPGTVIAVKVSVGDQVKAGQVLLVFEAMKMENELVAPRDGTVVKVHVAKGDILESSKVVISLA